MQWFKSLAKFLVSKVGKTVLTPLLATNIVRVCLEQSYLPRRLRQLLLWPLTTYLLPQG